MPMYKRPRYRTGDRDAVIRYMAECAIRDRQAMIDSLTPSFGIPNPINSSEMIRCRDAIEDFKQIVNSLKKA